MLKHAFRILLVCGVVSLTRAGLGQSGAVTGQLAETATKPAGKAATLPSRPGELKLELLVQPTRDKKPAARKINELMVFGDRLYIGCGDAVTNTGPTDILFFDLKSGKVVKDGAVDDEAIMRYCNLGGVLAIPGTDATEDWSYGNCYTLEDGKWQKHRTIRHGLHVFDIVDYQGRWYVSTLGYFDFPYGPEDEIGKEPPGTGMILSSCDKGKTWRFEYASSVDINTFSLTPHLAVFQGKLYAFRQAQKSPRTKQYLAAHGKSGGPVEDAFSSMETVVCDGGLWRGLDLIKESGLIGVRPVPVGDKFGLLAVFKNKRALYEFDGRTAAPVDFKLDDYRDVLAKKDHVYLLIHRDDCWLVARTSDLSHWAHWPLPREIDPLSIEVDRGTLYVGTKDGNIYSGTLPKE
jgi:hypothetical protein